MYITGGGGRCCRGVGVGVGGGGGGGRGGGGGGRGGGGGGDHVTTAGVFQMKHLLGLDLLFQLREKINDFTTCIQNKFAILIHPTVVARSICMLYRCKSTKCKLKSKNLMKRSTPTECVPVGVDFTNKANSSHC